MAYDPSKHAAVNATNTAKSEDERYKRIDPITVKSFTRLEFNDNDNVVEAIEILLGIKPGGVEKAIELLGVTTAVPATDEETTGATKKGYLPAYEHDGSPLGTGFKSEEDAKSAGFEVWLEADGTVKGWRKPAPKPIAAGSAKVTVVDKKGHKISEIDLDDYKKHPEWYDVREFGSDGITPLRVFEKRHR